MDYERREAPSLQGFMAWLRAAQTEIKRDMAITRDEVRVMTVHGAKGLEAPLVILADTTSAPARAPAARGRRTRAGGGWAGRGAMDVGAVTAARERARAEAEHEHRRLLYV